VDSPLSFVPSVEWLSFGVSGRIQFIREGVNANAQPLP
jgi:hypothetical protein